MLVSGVMVMQDGGGASAVGIAASCWSCWQSCFCLLVHWTEVGTLGGAEVSGCVMMAGPGSWLLGGEGMVATG